MYNRVSLILMHDRRRYVQQTKLHAIMYKYSQQSPTPGPENRVDGRSVV